MRRRIRKLMGVPTKAQQTYIDALREENERKVQHYVDGKPIASPWQRAGAPEIGATAARAEGMAAVNEASARMDARCAEFANEFDAAWSAANTKELYR